MDDEQWKALLEQVRQQGETLDSAQRRQSMTQLASSLGVGSGFREELPVSQAGLRAMTVKPRKLRCFSGARDPGSGVVDYSIWRLYAKPVVEDTLLSKGERKRIIVESLLPPVLEIAASADSTVTCKEVLELLDRHYGEVTDGYELYIQFRSCIQDIKETACEYLQRLHLLALRTSSRGGMEASDIAKEVLRQLNLKSSEHEKRCSIEYMKDLQKRLKRTYQIAQEAMKKASRRAKVRYDLRVRGAVPEAGDLVLVKLVGLTGKHKLADKWESEPYEIIRKPDYAMPVYVVKRCDGEGHERTLHRNMLFPLALPRTDDNAGGIEAGSLPETDTESSGSDSRALTRSRQAPVEEQSSSYSEDEEIQVITDESGNDIQARNAPIVPLNPRQSSAEEPNSNDDTSEQEDEKAPQIRRSTRVKRRPQRFRDGTYVMYPQTVSTSQWKDKFDVLWSNFPEKRQEIYDSLLRDVNLMQS